MTRDQILKLYKKSLSVPVKKPERPFLLCPVGLVASGKTTVVKPLAKSFSLVRISGDEIRILMRKYMPEYSQSDVLYVAFELIQEFLAKGYGVAIDSNCGDKVSKMRLVGRKFSVPVIWIHVKTPHEFIVSSLKKAKYKPSLLFKSAEERLKGFNNSKKSRKVPAVPFAYAFDISRGDFVEQIKDSKKIIKDKLKMK